MPIRPAPAHWFETYVPRDQTVYALVALANTGVVQLEQDPRLAQSFDLEAVSVLIDRFQFMREQYRTLLPEPVSAPEGSAESAEEIARRAVECLEDWHARLDALLQRQRRLDRERRNLNLLRECITAIHAESQDSEHLVQKSRFLYMGLFACPRSEKLAADICASIDEFIPGAKHNFFIIMDEQECRDIIDEAYRNKACQRLQIPEWLPSDTAAQLDRIDEQLAIIDAEYQQTIQALEKKNTDPTMASALADIDLLDWYLRHSKQLSTEGKLCHVTGWTTSDSVDRLQQVFRKAGIHGVIRYASPPAFSRIPVELGQPWWARPFIFIVQMLGTPDSTEIDTSKLLPFIVPLLFGYMFPDIGHGLVLVLISAVLYRRWPTGRLLIPCGLSAMFFGLVFGEFFGMEHVVDPLWVSPLESPVEVLVAPMLFGVGLIQLGLIFNGAEAVWRREAGAWLMREAPVMVLYPAFLIGLLVHDILWIAALAAAWFLLGQLQDSTSSLPARVGMGIGLLLHAAFQLLQNTLSFVRVGAFALAHAALSAAILGITGNISNEILHILLLVLGHIFIIAIEGLVVFVQTTRLVLLEFFIRFLRAEGRLFSPLGQPPGHSKKDQR